MFDRRTWTLQPTAESHQCHPDDYPGLNSEILPSVSRQHYVLGRAVIAGHQAFGLTAGTVSVAVSRGLLSINL